MTAPRTFWLRATNAAGDNADDSVKVTPQVVAVSPVSPAGATLTAGKAQGFVATVRWAVDTNVTWSASGPGGGGTWVDGYWTAPSIPGDYTITATAQADGTTSQSTVVHVVAAPTITSFAASKTVVTTGNATGLIASFSGGAGVVDNGVGAVTSGVSQGTPILSSVTTFTLTVTNAAGDTATAQVVVNVVPPAVITGLGATPNPVPYGGATTLYPQFSDATVASIDQGVGSVTSGNGYATGPLTSGLTYTLTATNTAGDSATKSLSVVVQSPLVSPVTSSGGYVSVGYPMMFSASVTQASDTSIIWSAAGPGGTGTWTGSTWTAPLVPGTYTITATAHADGVTSQTATITVVDLPIASGLTASTLNPLHGASISLNPSFNLGNGSIDQGIGSVVSGKSYVAGPITSVTTYTLTVTNLAGQTATYQTTVSPQMVGLSAMTPAAPTVTAMSATAFSVSVSGGATGNVVWSSIGGNWASNIWTAPSTAGSYVVTATSQDDPSKSVSTTVTVVAPPLAVSLVASNQSPAFGDSITLTPTYSGGTGSLDAGVPCPVSGVASSPISVDWNGAKTFALTVTNAAGDTASSSVVVTAQPVSIAALTPSSSAVYAGGYVPFAVPAVTGSASSGVVWTTSGGTMSGTGDAGSVGYWKAPMVPGIYTVTATAAQDPGASSTSTLTVLPTQNIQSFSVQDLQVPFGGTTSMTGVWSTDGVATVLGGPNAPYSPVSGVALSAGPLVAPTTFTLNLDGNGATYKNLIPNGDGELGNAAILAGGPGAAGLVDDPSNAYGGNWARRWAVVLGTGNGCALSDWTPASPGDNVQFSVRMKASAGWTGNQVNLRIVWTDTAGNAIPGETASSAVTPATSYAPFAVQGTAPADAYGFFASWDLDGAPGDVGTNLFMDDLLMEFLPTASVSVDVTPVTISAISGGTGYVTVGHQLGLSATCSGGVDQQVAWTATAGAFDQVLTQSGGATHWTAPAALGVVSISASSHADPSKVSTIPVQVVAAPVATTLSASAMTITSGNGVTLTPTFSGGSATVGTGGPGSSDLSALVVSGTGVPTGPLTSTTTFTLSVTNPAGDVASTTVTITVVPPPTASGLAPAKATVTAGTTTMLTPAFSGGVAQIGTSGPGSSEVTASAQSGVQVQTWSLVSNTTFTLTVKNAAGDTATATTTVSVAPGASGSLTASATSPFFGATNETVTPVFDGGTAKIGTTQGGGEIASSAVSGVPIPVQAAGFVAPAVYWLRVTNAAGDNWDYSLSITPQTVLVSAVKPVAPTLTVGGNQVFTANVTGAYDPNLTWSATGGVIDSASGSWTAPATPGAYTITATSNADPTKQVSTTATVIGYPVISSFAASPSTISEGQTTTLMATFSGGTGTVDQGVGGVTSGVDVTTGPLSDDTTFTLTVTNPVGGAVSQQVTVLVPQVKIVSISPSNSTKTAGTTTVFSAVVTGGATNTVIWNSTGGTWSGNSWTAPGTPGTYTITATSVDNPAKTISTTVTVVAAPVASGLTASNNAPAANGTFTLTPVYSNGVGSIDNGVTCYPSGVPTLAILANWTGPRTFTLTVTNAAGDVATTSVTVTPQVVTVVSISPSNGSRTVGTTADFTATITGGVSNAATWSGSGGSWSGNTWTAPMTPGTYTITATSVDDPTKTGSTQMTVVAAPVATSLVAAVNPVVSGNSTTVTPTFSGGTAVVDQGVGSVTSGVPFNTGNLLADKTYTLTVTNSAGTTASTSLTVKAMNVPVTPVTPANPYVTAGATVNFSASASGGVVWSASAGTMNPSTGVWVAPSTAPQSVTITATSVTDSTSYATTTAYVVAAPVISSFSASPSSLAYNQTSTLSFQFSGGNGVIDQGVGSVVSGISKGVGPLKTTTAFTLTVTNAAGTTASQTTNINVTQIVVSNLTPSNPTVSVGTSTGFSVSVTGGVTNSVIWSSTGGTWAGSTWTAPLTPGTYSVTATSTEDGTKSASTMVTVVALPVATSLTTSNASPAFGGTFTLTPVYSNGVGSLDNGVACPASGVASSPVTANWSGSRTFTLTVTNAAGATSTKSVMVTPTTVVLGSISPAAPTVTAALAQSFSVTASGGAANTVSWSATGGSFSPGSTGSGASTNWTVPSTPGTYTVTATSLDDPSKTVSTTVTVVAPPVASSLVAAVSPVLYGASTTITPTFSGGSGVIDHGIGTVTSGTAYSTGALTSGQTYTLTVTNAAGTTATTSVTVGVQTVSVAAITPAGATKTVNTAGVVFSSSVSGAANTALTWSVSVGAITGGQGTNSITWTAPSSPQTVTITATSQADGMKSSSTTVTVVAAPVATSLIPAKGTITVGGSTTLTPVFSNGTGEIGSSGVGSSDVTASASSGVAVSTGTLSSVKTYTFTLTVTNAAGSAASVNGAVVVVAAPSGNISASNSNPLYGATNVTVTPTFSGGTAVVGTTQGGSDISSNAVSGGAIPVQSGGFTTSKTYWVRVTNAAGDYVDASVNVTVQTVSVSPISNGGGYVSVGYTRSMSATTSGAANGILNWTANGGSFSPASTASGASTTWTAPGTPGTYTITATSAQDGSKHSTTSIQVVALPAISSLSASPSSVTVGNSSTVTGVFSGGSGSMTSFGAVNSGQGYSTGPLSATTTYTLTVTNLAGQSVSSGTTVSVYPVPSGSITVGGSSSISITAGQSTTLAWSTSGAASVSIDNYGAGLGASGSTSVSPGSTTTYTLRVTNGAGQQVAYSATVYVYPVPSGSITVGGSSSTSITAGQSTTLAWSTSGAASVSIDNYGAGLGASGSTSVSPGSTTTYTLRVTNGAGQQVAYSATVYVYPAASVSISVTSNITAGGSATLSWSSTNASYVDIANYGSHLAASGSVIIYPASTTTYTATAYNPAGSPSASSSRTVNVWAAPSISSFTANPTTVNSGQSSTLYPVFNAPGGGGSISPVVGAVSSGGAYGTGSLSSTTTFTLTATNGAGASTSASTTVTVSSGPAPVLTVLGLYQVEAIYDGCTQEPYYGLGFTATCDSWQMVAPNGKVWSGGALSSTSTTYVSSYFKGSWISPAFVENALRYCDANEYNEYAQCAVGTWTLTLTRNGQVSTTTWTYVAGTGPASNPGGPNLPCPW
jgi:hypothetical protein